ncbi:alpha/beta fold hydrolase [Gryllotalpicola protaetiae]|uniref:Alpha/beta fold hydrolase n=1 Tax=Gryllotalpicola protaetiae TaxID=2419771 RepID=A0A387BI48_9MICO|nr:alpha/beta fold hydrolase [Gryllotalpicola protaetiae]AYG03725.1 alpha/beta fold hydrolase [Gryllotalpicola protaetiae]
MPTFADDQGVVVTYYEYPVDDPKGVVQLAHGLGEHAGRYAHVARALNDAGYAVYADDHRGHGQTGLAQWGGDVTQLGKLGPGGLRATIADLRQLGRIIRARHPSVPVILLGHSWGSLMAQMLINRHAADYDAVVLTGTAYRMLGSMRSGDLNALHKNLGTTGHEWLSRDTAVQTAFDEDPLNFSAETIAKFGIVDAMRMLGRPARNLERDVPLLIQIGSDDSLGGEKSVVKLANAYRTRSGLSDVTVHIYTDARHEVFNELNKEEVLADLVAWLDSRILT